MLSDLLSVPYSSLGDPRRDLIVSAVATWVMWLLIFVQ